MEGSLPTRRDIDRLAAWSDLHRADSLLRAELSRRLEAEAGTTLLEHEALVRRLAEEAIADEPRASLTFERWEQYRNMRDWLNEAPVARIDSPSAIITNSWLRSAK